MRCKFLMIASIGFALCAPSEALFAAGSHASHHAVRHSASHSAGACRGTERWRIKVATDPDAGDIDVDDAKTATVAEINQLAPGEPFPGPLELKRLPEEKQVYKVQGYLGFFKHEVGKTGDRDYHLVITDKTGKYTKAGERSKPTGHSFVAEIPDPDCFAGATGGPAAGPLQDAVKKARACFEKNMAHVTGSHIKPASIPVTVTGVAFFDFSHGQVGRSVKHITSNKKKAVTELHPVVAIEFGNGEPCAD